MIVFIPFSLIRKFTNCTDTWSVGTSNLIRKLAMKTIAPMPACARSSKPDALIIVESRRQNVTQKLRTSDKMIILCELADVTTFPLCLSHLTNKQPKYSPYFMFRLIKVISLLSILNMSNSNH